MEQFFRNACWLHLETAINQYLMSNAHGHRNGAEKALTHIDLCVFYVAVFYSVQDINLVRRRYDGAFRAVHESTQLLTDNLDTAIGFPLEERPDYERLAPLFFAQFHELSMKALAEFRLPDWPA